MGFLSFISLILAVSIGFAIDLLFASLAMNLKNGCFAALAVREAVYSLLSGEMIPFSLFPYEFDRSSLEIHKVMALLSGFPQILDMEIKKAPIEDIVANLYLSWREN